MGDNSITVIIPAVAGEKIEDIRRTISSVLYDSSGYNLLDVYLVTDGWELPDDSLFTKYMINVISTKEKVGIRVIENLVARKGKGNYLLRLDAHCKLTEDWDTHYIRHCESDGSSKNIIIPCIDSIHQETWESKNHKHYHVYLQPDGQVKWWKGKRMSSNLERTMSTTGTGWFCRRKFYLDYLIRDEDLAKWGAAGLELTLGCAYAGGKILLTNDVILGHVFNSAIANSGTGYPVSSLKETEKILIFRHSIHLYNLAKQFPDVPSWDNVGQDYICFPERYFNGNNN